MDRRTFLRWSAAGAAAAAFSTWLAACGSEERAREGPAVDAENPLADGVSRRLADAWRAARRAGRPLLVLVDPRDEEGAPDGGEILGAAINNATDVLLADLAVCEVVCTNTADLALAVPEAAALGTPYLFLVEWEDKPVVQPVSFSFEGLPDPDEAWRRFDDFDAAQAASEQAVRKRFARVAATIHDVLAKDRGMLERRAAANLAALGARAWKRIEAAARTGDATQEDVLAAGPLLRLAAEKEPAVPFLAALIAARTQTIQKSPPPGAKWATSMGCGMTIEGGEAPGYACGMGHVAPLCDRFLVYFTQE